MRGRSSKGWAALPEFFHDYLMALHGAHDHWGAGGDDADRTWAKDPAMARVAQWGYSFQAALQKWEKDEVDLHLFNEALKRDLNDMVFEDIDTMMRRLAKLLLYADLACSDQLAAEYHRREKKAKVKKKTRYPTHLDLGLVFLFLS